MAYPYTSPSFSHRVFKEFFDWLQDYKKSKLITRSQEEKMIKEECYEEIRISDQFLQLTFN